MPWDDPHRRPKHRELLPLLFGILQSDHALNRIEQAKKMVLDMGVFAPFVRSVTIAIDAYPSARIKPPPVSVNGGR